MGLSLMVKGPAGPVLILATVAAFLLISGRIRDFSGAVSVFWTTDLRGDSSAVVYSCAVSNRGAFPGRFHLSTKPRTGAGLEFAHNQPFCSICRSTCWGCSRGACGH